MYKKCILVACAAFILIGVPLGAHACISQDIDITGTWILYTGGNVAPDYPLLLCLCIWDAGGGWIPVEADDLSHELNDRYKNEAV